MLNRVSSGPYDTIFPEGIEAYSQEQSKAIFDFSDIIEAILNAPKIYL